MILDHRMTSEETKTGPDAVKTKKGERTRQAILDAALDLLREEGVEGATMRAVAKRAGVSVGNAYYYFKSKEHLVQGFYELTHREHEEACRELLEKETDFKKRLRGVLLAKIETAEPYHRLSGLLFKTAADPKSPLNPFSADSRETRDEATEMMQRVVEGSTQKVPADIADDLPELLWLYLMSIVLFWIHDESEGRARTRRLIDRTVEIVARLVSLSRLPLMGPLRRSAVSLVRELRMPAPPETSVELEETDAAE